MTAQVILEDRDPIAAEAMVQVVDLVSGREITWGGNVVEKLDERLVDVRTAIVAGVRAVSQSLDRFPAPAEWQLAELSAKFGITLAAEAGVVVSKASAEATFEVTVTFRRT